MLKETPIFLFRTVVLGVEQRNLAPSMGDVSSCVLADRSHETPLQQSGSMTWTFHLAVLHQGSD